MFASSLFVSERKTPNVDEASYFISKNFTKSVVPIFAKVAQCLITSIFAVYYL